MQRSSQSSGRIAGKIGGINSKREDFAAVERLRGGRAAQILDRLDKLRQSKALTRAGGPEKTDCEGGLGALVGGEFGEKAERRGETQRIGSVGAVGGKNRLRRRSRFGFDSPARRRRSIERSGVRLRQMAAGDNRSEIAQSAISHALILSQRAGP